MPLPKLPVHSLDDPNHRRRARETLNGVLDHSFDDSRRQSDIEKVLGITPVNPAYPPADVRRYGGDLSAAATVSEAGGGDIIIASAVSVETDLTIPAAATMRFVQGGQISVANNATLTINSKIVASRDHIFVIDFAAAFPDVPGVVEYGSWLVCRESIAYTEWFGAVHNNSDDDRDAIQAALNMVAPAYGGVSLSTGYYKVEVGSLRVPTRCTLFGVSKIESVFSWVPTGNGDTLFDDSGGTDNVAFRNFSILASGASTGKRGFTFSDAATDYRYENLGFSGLNDWCIAHDGAQHTYVVNCRFVGTHNGTDTGTAIQTTTFANRFSITECRFSSNDRDIDVDDSGSAINIAECGFESTGSLIAVAADREYAIRLVGVRGFSISGGNYFEGVRTQSSRGAIELDDCAAGTVEENLLNGAEPGGTVYTHRFVNCTGDTRGVRVNNNSMTDVITAFVSSGNFAVECHGNQYVDGGVQLTTYQDVMALMEGDANIDLDLPFTFTYNPGNLADGAGETAQQSMDGASFGDTYSVAAPYDLEDVTIGVPYTQSAGVVEFRLQNESGGARDLASGTWRIYRKAGNV